MRKRTRWQWDGIDAENFFHLAVGWGILGMVIWIATAIATEPPKGEIDELPFFLTLGLWLGPFIVALIGWFLSRAFLLFLDIIPYRVTTVEPLPDARKEHQRETAQ